MSFFSQESIIAVSDRQYIWYVLYICMDKQQSGVHFDLNMRIDAYTAFSIWNVHEDTLANNLK